MLNRCVANQIYGGRSIEKLRTVWTNFSMSQLTIEWDTYIIVVEK